MTQPPLIDDHQTDYQQGNVILEIAVTKMANGQFKATGMGLEANDRSSENAVLKLQDQLQDGLLKGTIRPGM